MEFNNFNFWGPYAWYKFHTKAIKYPKNPCNCNIKRIVRYYYKIFPKYIACDSCKSDYKKMLKLNPIKTKSRKKLFIWTVNIHNIVNAKLRKPKMGYYEAYQYWKGVVKAENFNTKFLPNYEDEDFPEDNNMFNNYFLPFPYINNDSGSMCLRYN